VGVVARQQVVKQCQDVCRDDCQQAVDTKCNTIPYQEQVRTLGLKILYSSLALSTQQQLRISWEIRAPSAMGHRKRPMLG
jgi:hypothetical protein